MAVLELGRHSLGELDSAQFTLGCDREVSQKTAAGDAHRQWPLFALFAPVVELWVAFNQVFMTLPEYIRDFSETNRIVDMMRSMGLSPRGARYLRQ